MIAALGQHRPGTLVLMLHRGLDRLLDLYPEARIVHMLRDPRDVARSSIGMGWAGHVYFGVDHWIKTERGWGRCLHRIPEDRRMELRYDDLIRTPHETLTRLCRFAGLDFDPAMLSYDSQSSYAAPDTSLIDQWRRS